MKSTKGALRINTAVLGCNFDLVEGKRGEEWVVGLQLEAGPAVLVRPDQHILNCYTEEISAEQILAKVSIPKPIVSLSPVPGHRDVLEFRSSSFFSISAPGGAAAVRTWGVQILTTLIRVRDTSCILQWSAMEILFETEPLSIRSIHVIKETSCNSFLRVGFICQIE